MEGMRGSHTPYIELAHAYALQVLPASEMAATEAHIAAYPACQRESKNLRSAYPIKP
jgi:anti-sigma factor RsiW